MDLTPRTSTALDTPPGERRPAKRRRGLGAGAVAAIALVAVGFLLYQFLSSAAVYYCNADQVGHTHACSTDKRFRLQGTVDKGSVQSTGVGIDFTVSFRGVTIPVHHLGDPPDLFKEGLPVVLEGRMQGATYESDRIMVKHSAEYKAKNPSRVDPAAP